MQIISSAFKALLVIGALFMAAPAVAQTPRRKADPDRHRQDQRGEPEGAVTFNRDALEALGMVTFETKTPWYKEPVKFEGVPLDKLMKAVGANGDRVVAVALNDYSERDPDRGFRQVSRSSSRSSATANTCRCATRGRCSSSIRMTADPELKSQKFYSRSVWQVAQLIVK